MQEVISAVERIRLLPDATIGCNFSQGRQAVADYLRAMKRTAELTNLDAIISKCKTRSRRLRELVAPYSLPEDYLFFQDYYGGLVLETSKGIPQLMVMGTGPLAGLYYGELLEGTEESLPSNPFYFAIYWSEKANGLRPLEIARNSTLSPFDDEHVLPSPMLSHLYYIDSSGVVKTDSILVARSDEGPNRFTKIAGSFTEWLNLVAEKSGQLEEEGS